MLGENVLWVSVLNVFETEPFENFFLIELGTLTFTRGSASSFLCRCVRCIIQLVDMIDIIVGGLPGSGFFKLVYH
jgi:hypothetical protein